MHTVHIATNNKSPLIPTEGAPAATAAKAYSICTNFPDGLKNKYTVTAMRVPNMARYLEYIVVNLLN